MQQSKFLSRFQQMSVQAADAYELIGDCLLVEKIPIAERKTASGLIVRAGQGERQRDTMSTDVPTFVHVLAVGKGYYDDETGKDIPLHIKPGNIALVGASSVRWFSDMDIADYQPYEIGLTREAEIKLVYKDEEAYHRAFSHLNPRT